MVRSLGIWRQVPQDCEELGGTIYLRIRGSEGGERERVRQGRQGEDKVREVNCSFKGGGGHRGRKPVLSSRGK